MTIRHNVNYESTPELVLGVHIQTDSVTPTTGLNYKRGDLLAVDDNNVATHGTVGNWHVVCASDVTAEQVEKHLKDKKEIGVYVAGELNAQAVRLNGTLLNDDERKQARGRAKTGTNINLKETA